MPRYFLDTEFIEDGRTIELVSIGIVSEDKERAFYRQNRDCNFKLAGDWVWRNVFPHLAHFSMKGEPSCYGLASPDSVTNTRRSLCGPECPWRTRYEIRDELKAFLDPQKYGKPEIWGYYADYDWVAFCQLFGPMSELPKGFPMWCRDLKQLCVSVGDPQLPDCKGEHNALEDADWNRHVYDFLKVKPSLTH